MLKKGDKFKFTCNSIIEATPDFILYDVKEDNGEYDKYLEKYQYIHLIPKTEYEATVTGLTIFENNLVIILNVNSINSDEIKDRTMYKPIISQFAPLFRFG